MLMFFTLASSMVGDVTDEDELQPGTRSEGSFYSVFWWFISMGTAFAGLVMGALLVFTAFDETQNVSVEAMQGSIERIKAMAKSSSLSGNEQPSQSAVDEQLKRLIEHSSKLRLHFAAQLERRPDQAAHLGRLVEQNDSVRSEAETFRTTSAGQGVTSEEVVFFADRLLEKFPLLKRQSPTTLLRLRLFEIAVPLAMSVVSILLTLRYPLTEARCYEIKAALKQRHAAK
jgi:Na+/melibiose symporter-like transporter